MYYFACPNISFGISGVLTIAGFALAAMSILILLVAYVVNVLSEMPFRKIFAIEGVLLLTVAGWSIGTQGQEEYAILMFLGAALCAVLSIVDWFYVSFIKAPKSQARRDFCFLELEDRSL